MREIWSDHTCNHYHRTEGGTAEYMDDVFTKNGSFSNSLKIKRDKYEITRGQRAGIRNLQNLFKQYIDIYGSEPFSNEICDLDSHNNDLPIMGDIQFQRRLAGIMIRGALLDAVASDTSFHPYVDEKLCQLIDDLNIILGNINGILNQITEIDEIISPPEDLDIETVTFDRSKIELLHTNVTKILECIKDLESVCKINSENNTLGLVWYLITSKYKDFIEESTQDFTLPIDVTNDAEQLKSEYSEIIDRVKNKDESFFEDLEITKEQTLSNIEEFGTDIFNLQNIVGGDTLSLSTDDEIISSISDHYDHCLDTISSLNNAIDIYGNIKVEIQMNIEETKSKIKQKIENFINGDDSNGN